MVSAGITLAYSLKNSNDKLNGFFALIKRLNFRKQRKNYSSAVCAKIVPFLEENSIPKSSLNYYVEAFTHRSFVEIEPSIQASNQRLEYLGDAVLGMVTAEYLFINFTDEEEGFLTKTRSNIVKKDALAYFANELHLHKYILYDKRFIQESEAGFSSILVDCLEAVIGAIYLDAGFQVAESFIKKHIIQPSVESGFMSRDTNYKGRLLEALHTMKRESPLYETVREEGAEHKKVFTVEVTSAGKKLGTGKGRNKKSAEQNAAKKALSALNK